MQSFFLINCDNNVIGWQPNCFGKKLYFQPKLKWSPRINYCSYGRIWWKYKIFFRVALQDVTVLTPNNCACRSYEGAITGLVVAVIILIIFALCNLWKKCISRRGNFM